MPTADRLVPVPRAEWPPLRDLYRRDWPRHLLGYQTIDTFIRWSEQRPSNEDIDIFSLNGDWSDGTFVCVSGENNSHLSHLVNTVSNSTTRLATACGLIKFNTEITNNISFIMEQHRSVVDKVLTLKKITPTIDYSSLLVNLPQAKAMAVDIECPAGITLAPLREEHVGCVDAAWSFGGTAFSWFSVQRNIALNVSVGAFDGSGKLLAWCLRNITGQLAVLQVADAYRGRGLGSLVCRAITRKLGEMGEDVNGPSRPRVRGQSGCTPFVR